MSDDAFTPTGQVGLTPEGGPLHEGIPPSAPGAGQVRPTPEAGPLTPPTLRDHMQGPILGLDDLPAASAPAEKPSSTSTHPSPGLTGEGPGVRANAGEQPGVRKKADNAELKKWPPYSGKPVSEVHWDDARRFAAPLISQAEKLTIQAIGFTGRGLSRLARALEERRTERNGGDES